MNLKKILNLKIGDKVVVVGSGGKTTFCLNLCEELKNEKKTVIFTTTTKIYPVDSRYGFIDLTKIEENEIEKILKDYIFEKKIYLLGNYDEKIGKIKSLNTNLLEQILEKADYTVIEGDGSKCKKIKGWNKNEPVYLKSTTKSVGIIPINCVGMKINDENIHRLEKFLEISKSKEGENLTIEILKNVITHKNGLFQYSKGRKYLILNCVEDENDLKNAIELGKLLKKETEIEIILASLKNKKYLKLERDME